MELPADFPHTRHEQYLVALPVHLLTSDEGSTVIRVLGAVRRHYEAQTAQLFAELLPARPSKMDLAIALAVIFGPLWLEDRWRRGPLARPRA
jgi:hypothetical protein